MSDYKTHVSWFRTRPPVANAHAATVTAAAPFTPPQTYRELRAALKAAGKPVHGTKAQLIARLSNV